jgi:hypothetical protein
MQSSDIKTYQIKSVLNEVAKIKSMICELKNEIRVISTEQKRCINEQASEIEKIKKHLQMKIDE